MRERPLVGLLVCESVRGLVSVSVVVFGARLVVVGPVPVVRDAVLV